jgi:hypothetical protein
MWSGAPFERSSHVEVIRLLSYGSCVPTWVLTVIPHCSVIRHTFHSTNEVKVSEITAILNPVT